MIQVGEALPRELNDKQMMLDKFQRSRLEPQKTKEDVVSQLMINQPSRRRLSAHANVMVLYGMYTGGVGEGD